MRHFFAMVALLVGLAGHAVAAEEWFNFATVSMTDVDTAKLADRRLCFTDGRTIACDAQSLYLSTGGLVGIGTANPNAKLDVYGTVSATNFVGNGSGLTGITAASSDRIVSSSTSMLAISNTGYISITQAATNTGWFDPQRGLVTLGVSATGGISGTTGYFNNGARVWGYADLGGAGTNFVRFAHGGAYGAMQAYTAGSPGPLVLNGSGGNVGIGTGLPTATLQVSGSMIVSVSGQTTTPSFVVAGNGNVGIGTSTPGSELEISSSAPAIFFSNGTNTHYVGSSGANMYVVAVSSTSSLILGTSNTARINIRGNGNVGVSRSIAIATLDVEGTISASDAIQVGQSALACATSISGSIRYSTTSDTLQICTGAGWKSLVSGTAGAGTLATLGDVSLTNIAGRDYLRYDAGTSTWVNISESAVMSTTTVVGGWPDAVYCSYASGYMMLYRSLRVTSTAVMFYELSLGGTRYYINFALGGGTYNTNQNLTGSDCLNKSISDLYSSGQAFNFIGNAAGTTTAVSSTGAVQFNVNNSLAGDAANFFWDDTNNRLGIGTNSPTAALDVSSAAGSLWVRKGTGGALPSGAGEGLKIESSIYGAVLQAYDYAGMSGKNLSINGSGGNVGVGTLFPTARFQVSGSFIVSVTGQTTSPSLYVGANGSVGIGTSAPTSYLDISSNSANSTFMNLINTGPNGRAWTLYSSGGGPSAAGLFGIYDSTVGGTRLSISSSGSIGIGTTNPIARLDVSGTISATNAIQVGQSALACATSISGSIRYSTTSDTLQICTGAGWKSLPSTTIVAGVVTGSGSATAVAYWSGASGLTYDADGFYWDANNDRLGVGTSTPGSTLHVSGSAAFGGPASGKGYLFAAQGAAGFTGYYGMYMANGTRLGYLGYGSPSYGLPLVTDNATPLTFLVSGTEAMRIAPGGNVGIGTNAPIATLQVSGSMIVSVTGQTTTPTLFVGTSGNVGVGISAPVGKIDVVGGRSYFTPNSEPYAVYLRHNLTATGVFLGATAVGDFQMSNAGGLPMMTVVSTTGKVGLGTATPIAKLDVVGTISASDAIQVGQSVLACATSISGSIRYSTVSDTLQICTGAGWKSLVSGTTGGGSMATLTDVSASAPLNNQILKYNASLSKWEAISETANAFSCPVGFTLVQSQNNALGCMQNAEQGSASWENATNTCFTTYGGRLPGHAEWYTAMNNYTLTGETGNWEWLDDYVGEAAPNTHHGVAGNTALTDNGFYVGSTNGPYRCFIPANGTVTISGSTALGDRITSGTLAMIANSTTSIVSLSSNGTTWGYFSSNASYLPQLSSQYVSSTNISTTRIDGSYAGYFGSALARIGVGAGIAMGERGAYLYYDTGNDIAQLQAIHQGTGFKPIGLNVAGGNVAVGKVSAVAKLDVNGTISASDAIQVGQSALACATSISGSVRYSIVSDTLQICTGSGWKSLVSGTAGAGTLATLGDVNLTNIAGRDYLRYDAGTSKWVNISESTVMSTTTMVAGWPDAIRCYASNPGHGWRTAYLEESPYLGNNLYYYREPGNNIVWVYNANGTYNAANSANYTTTNCAVSISQLYAAGQAYNFIGSADTGGSALGDRITSGTTTLTTISNTGFVSLTQGGANTGWFDPTRGLVTLGISSTGRISGTSGYFNGNVGIGSKAPQAQLEIQGSGYFGGKQILLSGDEPDRYSGNIGTSYIVGGSIALSFGTRSNYVDYDNTLNLWNGNIGIRTVTPMATLQISGSMLISRTGQITTPSFYVGTDGNIGLGTTAPSQGTTGGGAARTLNVSDSTNAVLRLNAGTTDAIFQTLHTGGTYIGTLTSSSPSQVTFVTGGNQRMVLDNAGGIGIGTATPAVSLTVVGEVQVSSSGVACNAARTGAIRYVSGTGAQVCNSAAWSSMGSGGGLTGTGSATAVAYWSGASGLTYDTDGFYWDAANNRLGIATNSPSQALTVDGVARVRAPGSSRYRADFFIGSAAGMNLNAYDDTSSTFLPGVMGFSTLRLLAGPTAGVEALYANASGYIGLGTLSPTATLQVSGSMIVSRTGQTTTPTLYVGTNGNVGIGTSSPVNALSVVGAAGSSVARFTDNTNETLLVEFATGGRTNFRSGSGRIWLTQYGALVGISNSTPSVALSVGGEVQVSNTGIACDTARKGAIRYSDISSTIEYCNSTAWTSVGPSDTSPVSFMVTKNGTDQALSSNVMAAVTWPTEVHDSNNNFASNKFTPTVPGKYLLMTTLRCGDYGQAVQFSYCDVYLNSGGATRAVGRYRSSLSTFTYDASVHAMAIVDMNGTTDFAEVYVVADTTKLDGSAYLTTFEGVLLSPQGGVGGGATPAGSTGDIQFNSSGALAADTNELFWDDANNRLGIGTGTPAYDLDVNGFAAATVFLQTSDRRLKENIKQIDSGLAIVEKLKPVTFNWRRDHTASAGFIAQDLQGVLPNAVVSDSTGSLKVEYNQLLPYVIKGMQELKAANDNLRKVNDGLSKRLDQIERKVMGGQR